MRRLRHIRIELAVHELRGGTARPLVLLHGLGEQSPSTLPDWAASWPGPVVALDFTGHGQSTVPPGGGYTCEALMGDVDTVLQDVGEATVLGRGLGAWVALLIAGARPTLVRGAVLADGPGLAGGGPAPGSPYIIRWAGELAPGNAPDQMALAELSRDVRPPDYATSYVRLATQFSDLATPIMVAATYRPPWLAAVADEPGVQEGTTAEALAFFAEA